MKIRPDVAEKMSRRGRKDVLDVQVSASGRISFYVGTFFSVRRDVFLKASPWGKRNGQKVKKSKGQK